MEGDEWWGGVRAFWGNVAFSHWGVDDDGRLCTVAYRYVVNFVICIATPVTSAVHCQLRQQLLAIIFPDILFHFVDACSKYHHSSYRMVDLMCICKKVHEKKIPPNFQKCIVDYTVSIFHIMTAFMAMVLSLYLKNCHLWIINFEKLAGRGFFCLTLYIDTPALTTANGYIKFCR